MIISRIAAAAALISLLLTAVLWAEEPTPAELLEKWDRDSTRAEEVLASEGASTPALEVLRETLVELRFAARAMVADQTKKLEPLRQQREALGPPPAEGVTEAAEVAEVRVELNNKIEASGARLKKAELALARSDALIKELDGIIRSRFTGALMSIGPSPLSPWRWPGAVAEYVGVGDRLLTEAERAYNDPIAQKTRQNLLPALVLAVALAIALVLWARRRVVSSLRAQISEGAGRGRRLYVGLAVAALRLIGPLIVVAMLIFALRQSGLLGPTALRLEEPLLDGLIALILAYTLGQVIFGPNSPELRIAPLADPEARRAARLTNGLGLVLLLDQLLIRGAADIGLATMTLAVANLGLTVVAGLMLFRLAALLRPAPPPPVVEDSDLPVEPRSPLLGALRRGVFILRAAAVLSPILAAIGYFAASRFLLFPVIMTVGLFAGALILFISIREAVDAYAEEQEVEARGFRLLSILSGFLIGCAALPVLALIWGARTADLTEWWGLFSEGLVFGDVNISPIDFLTFALVFTIGYTLTRLIQGVLRMSVLPNTSLDSGARAAITSGTGYLGFFLAALAAIAATGLDLSNIAIVAGALSVGIGFGLQNIVNNFVSGIILLIERPIKSGDWIEVGGASGYVSKISVRATEIETFDRATLIVPNSELISGSVLNMTHSNMIGRVRVPVGVAYGTDVRNVETILGEIVAAHPMVLKRPAPSVMFMGFGADSLDFEIRGFLRDVNWVLSTKSDMNFEIERRFREEGIEIPFAQRDLHLKNVDELGQAVGDAIAKNR